MRLIDADMLMECYDIKSATKYDNETAEQRNHSYSTLMLYEINAMIDDSPTIDAEKVVRCKGCSHYFEFGNWCNKNSCAVSENDFCSRAEKSQLVKLPKHGETT